MTSAPEIYNGVTLTEYIWVKFVTRESKSRSTVLGEFELKGLFHAIFAVPPGIIFDELLMWMKY